MNKKKALIVGNHCCSNRGDAAILRGLIDYLAANYPNISVDITSRYTSSASWMFERHFFPDSIHQSANKGGVVAKKIRNKLKHLFIIPFIAKFKRFPPFLRLEEYRDFKKEILEYDFVIQVGGSFFVDLYGQTQYESSLVCLLADIPVIMLGHSVGPFEKNNVKDVARAVFNECSALVLREKISHNLLEAIGIQGNNIIRGADTAWLIDDSKATLPSHLCKYFARPCIAITCRLLAPFDKRLNVTQESYEKKMAYLADYFIEKGYDIIAASTCTGLDSYNRDDRMIALSIRNKVKKPQSFHVLMDEFTDLELGKVLGECRLTVGTRLHSCILSMRFGTPAYAIYYEHKSKGILEQMGLESLSIAINELDSPEFLADVSGRLNNLGAFESAVKDHVEREAARAGEAVDRALEMMN